VSIASVEEVMRERFHGDALVINVSAVKKTYDITKIESDSV
jgi:hypothetical protein